MTAPLSADDALTTEAVIQQIERVDVEHLTPLQRFINRSRVKPTEGQIEYASGHVAALRSLLRAALARLRAQGTPQTDWQPIETAPKGSWPDGPHNTRDPAYVEPPRLWLTLNDGRRCVGYFEAYYAEGGLGYDGGSVWVEAFSSERVSPTHWMPLPSLPPPRPEPQEKDQ